MIVLVGREFRRAGALLGLGLFLVIVALAWGLHANAYLTVVIVVLLITLAVYVAMWFRFGRAVRVNEDPSAVEGDRP